MVRKTFLQKRLELSLNEFQLLSFHAIKNVIELIEKEKPKCVHCFLPIDSKTEIDTKAIIKYCWENGIKVVVPVSDFKSSTMKSALITEETKLTSSNYNIPEPSSPIWEDELEIDLVITPLIHFDTLGYRVGYGKGFYDRFFNSLSKKVNKVGISLFEPIEQIEGLNEFDIALNYCATPKNTYSFL